MPDTISSPKPRHPLRPEPLHALDAPALDVSPTNNSACGFALPAPAVVPPINPAMTPPVMTTAGVPSPPPPVVLGKRAAHDMLPADGESGNDGPARMAKRPANDDRADGTAEQPALDGSAARQTGPPRGGHVGTLNAQDDESRRPVAQAQTNGSVVHSLPAALDVLIKATESCRVSLAQVKAERIALGEESAASVERLENGLRGLQEQGIAVVESYVRSIQAEIDLFRPRPLQNGTHGPNSAGNAAHAPPRPPASAAPDSSSQTADLANDAAVAHRMWAYLDKCAMDLDDGRRAWLIKYSAVKKQQEVYDKHVKSLHARQEHLHRMEEWLPKAEKVLAEGERECKRREDEVLRQRQKLTDQHRAVEAFKMNLMNWARDEGAAYQRRFGAVHLDGGGNGNPHNMPPGPAHYVGGSKSKIVKGEMYFGEPPFHVPQSPKVIHTPMYQSQHSSNGQSSKSAHPGPSLAEQASLKADLRFGVEPVKKKPAVVKLPKPTVLQMPDGMKAGPNGGKSIPDFLTLPPSPTYQKIAPLDAESEVSYEFSLCGGPPSNLDSCRSSPATPAPMTADTDLSSLGLALMDAPTAPLAPTSGAGGGDLECSMRSFAEELLPGARLEYDLPGRVAPPPDSRS